MSCSKGPSSSNASVTQGVSLPVATDLHTFTAWSNGLPPAGTSALQVSHSEGALMTTVFGRSSRRSGTNGAEMRYDQRSGDDTPLLVLRSLKGGRHEPAPGGVRAILAHRRSSLSSQRRPAVGSSTVGVQRGDCPVESLDEGSDAPFGGQAVPSVSVPIKGQARPVGLSGPPPGGGNVALVRVVAARP